jgi:hypothetical protein
MMGVTSRVMNLLLALAGAAMLTSCVTPPATESEAVFRFSVMRYREPVEVTGWKLDPTLAVNPEGAALNIITAMQHGDLGQWLASWDTDERPNPNQAERDSLLEQWQSLKGKRVMILGHVVAGSDVVEELSVVDSQKQGKELKLPLKHTNGQWWLTSLDTNSEYMNWETSTNKMLDRVDTHNIKTYLNQVKLASR